MLHNFAVNICAKVSLTLLFTCVKQCVDLADRLTDVLATAISYVTLFSLIKYPKYPKYCNLTFLECVVASCLT